MGEPKRLEGLVRKGIGGFYTVETDQGFYTCTARGKFRKKRISPYAGDWVRILGEEDGTGALEEILPRRCVPLWQIWINCSLSHRCGIPIPTR